MRSFSIWLKRSMPVACGLLLLGSCGGRETFDLLARTSGGVGGVSGNPSGGTGAEAPSGGVSTGGASGGALSGGMDSGGASGGRSPVGGQGGSRDQFCKSDACVGCSTCFRSADCALQGKYCDECGKCVECSPGAPCRGELRCDLFTRTCKRPCNSQAQCELENYSHCDPLRGVCVQCLDDSDCLAGVCVSGACMECRTREQCRRPQEPYCTGNRCRTFECVSNLDCQGGDCLDGKCREF